MKYYVRELGSNSWREVSRWAAKGMLDGESLLYDVDWNRDMLDVPNRIILRNKEIVVEGWQGEQPLDDYTNLREDEYYEIVGQDKRDPQTDTVELLKSSWNQFVGRTEETVTADEQEDDEGGRPMPEDPKQKIYNLIMKILK